MKSLLILFLALCCFVTTPVNSEQINSNIPKSYSGRTHPDALSTDFLKAILASMKISYTEEKTPKGQYIEWVTIDEALENEIDRRVSQYLFIKKVCTNLPLPSPSTPSKDKLSC